MKSLFIGFAVITAISISSFIFYKYPPEDTGNITKFTKGLSGIDCFLQPGTKLNLVCKEPLIQQIIELRYVLFPVQLQFENVATYDTTLIVLPSGEPDNFFPGKILWQNTDSNYSYTLVTKSSKK